MKAYEVYTKVGDAEYIEGDYMDEEGALLVKNKHIAKGEDAHIRIVNVESEFIEDYIE